MHFCPRVSPAAKGSSEGQQRRAAAKLLGCTAVICFLVPNVRGLQWGLGYLRSYIFVLNSVHCKKVCLLHETRNK